jgi:hypothetical protein
LCTSTIVAVSSPEPIRTMVPFLEDILKKPYRY